ncbi:ATP-dependent DNA/RNA helicase DHX36 [Exophiala dermatitidis]
MRVRSFNQRLPHTLLPSVRQETGRGIFLYPQVRTIHRGRLKLVRLCEDDTVGSHGYLLPGSGRHVSASRYYTLMFKRYYTSTLRKEHQQNEEKTTFAHVEKSREAVPTQLTSASAENEENVHTEAEDPEYNAEENAADGGQITERDGANAPPNITPKKRKHFDLTLPAANFLSAVDSIRLAREHGLTDQEVVPTAYSARAEPAWAGDILRHNHVLAAKMKSDLAESRQTEKMQAMLASRHKLPLMSEKVRPRLLELIKSCDVTIVLSKTGSGKTTQIPQIILDDRVSSHQGPSTSILCTQPRRIAATSTARRVAHERGEMLKDSVGYHIRNENWLPRQQGSITYCTTGILLNRLVADEWGTLQSHSHIIIDEVHERDVQIDLVLAILRKAVQRRKATGEGFPKIILMSATIDPSMFLDYFRQSTDAGVTLTAESFKVEGSTHHVEMHYLPELLSDLTKGDDLDPTMHALLQGKKAEISSADYIRKEMQFAKTQSRGPQSGHNSQTDESTVADATDGASSEIDRGYVGLATAVIAHLAHSQPPGDILVFLPGRADIDEIYNLLTSVRPLGVNFTDTTRFKIFKLHSRLRDSNDEVFKPLSPGCRRIILATNIAETSVTLPEVVYVVDSGLLRTQNFDPLTRQRSLPYDWISKTSVIQRRGRAGRVRNGHYYALFTKERQESFIAMRRPAIAVSDLVNVVLQLKAHPQQVGVREFLCETVEPPSRDAVESAIKDLQSLHALTVEDEKITNLGLLLSRFALHPAAAKGIFLGALFGCLEPMLILACHSSTDSLISHSEFTTRQLVEMKQRLASDFESDLVSVIEAFREYHAAYRAGDVDLMKDLQQRRPIRHHVYLDMMLASSAVHDILADVGFLPGPEPGRTVFELLPAAMNSDRDNMVLVKALALNTITPELAAWRERRPSKRLWSLDNPDVAGLVPRDSVNEKPTRRQSRMTRKYRSDGRLLAYSWKEYVADSNPKSVWLVQTSMVTPLMAVLFSRTVSLTSPRIVKINDWLRLRLNAEEGTPPVLAEHSARILVELRKTIGRFVALAWEELGFLDLSRIPKDSRIGSRRVSPGSTSSKKNVVEEEEKDNQHRPPSSGVLLNGTLRKVMVDSIVNMLNEDDAYWRAFRDQKRTENLEAEARRVEEMNLARDNQPIEDEDDDCEDDAGGDDLEDSETTSASGSGSGSGPGPGFGPRARVARPSGGDAHNPDVLADQTLAALASMMSQRGSRPSTATPPQNLE